MHCRQQPRILLAVLGFATVALVACAGAVRRQASGTRAVLLADEIEASGAKTVQEAVTRLRPEWLRARRGRTSMQDPAAGEVVVYLDGVRYGGMRALSTLGTHAVMNMTFLDATDATTRFGTGHGGGAILIRTR